MAVFFIRQPEFISVLISVMCFVVRGRQQRRTTKYTNQTKRRESSAFSGFPFFLVQSSP